MTRKQANKAELQRTLSLGNAMTIGIGTMIGAGIFVFPGLAAGRAGPAATLSFGLGGLIALLVALPASELATAMARSGGPYYFVRRGLGKFPGAMVGFCQWIGLIFASAFYMSGFTSYVTELLNQLGFSLNSSEVIIGLLTVIILIWVNIVGTKNIGELQNYLVFILLGILSVFLIYGLLNAFGFVGNVQMPNEFFSFGVQPVFTTTAFIFTSFLGFVQIANVAGEIKSPGRNLPLAMLGSILIVTIVYMGTIFVSTAVFSNQRLESLGETAIIAVARQLWGPSGVVIMLGAGLLATLSSANASILSSSRSAFALGQDRVVPGPVSRIHEKFSTPHLSLLITGVPIGALVLLGEVQLLAEVASLFHLIVYGLICIALIKLRHQNPDWYSPAFQTPGYPFLPALGAFASFALIAFMQTDSILLGGLVLLLSAGWYLVSNSIRSSNDRSSGDDRLD